MLVTVLLVLALAAWMLHAWLAGRARDRWARQCLAREQAGARREAETRQAWFFLSRQ